MIIHKPFLESREVPHKIWARSVKLFWRLLDTNGQTDKSNLKNCAVGVLVTEETICTIKVSFVSFIFQLFHDVNFFFLGLIFFCYNQLFERKSKIDFPDFSIFRFFTSHFHSFIKYGKFKDFRNFFINRKLLVLGFIFN